MPRPQKNFSDRRTCRIEVRLTESEEKILATLSSDEGLSISDLIRKAALRSKPRIQKANPERAALIRGLAEMGKIGGNMNQIAKALNTEIVTHQKISISYVLLTATLHSLNTLSQKLLNHLTDGYQG